MTEMQLTLSEASAADMAVLAHLNRQLHTDNRVALSRPEAAENLRQLMEAGYQLAVARFDPTPAGIAGYALWTEKSDRVYLRHFIVERSLRRRRIGMRFARLLLDRLPADKDVWLDIRTETAIRFWSAMGFRCQPAGMRFSRERETT